MEEKKRQLVEQSARLNYYAENYLELEKAYQSYKNLPDELKISLAEIFGNGDTATNFMASLLKEGHLEMLFEYITDALEVGGSDDEVENLLRIFDFAFKAVNGVSGGDMTIEIQADLGHRA